MLLVEEGKVDLDEPAAKYLKNLPEKWSAVTVRQLLSHTSGIKNDTAFPLDPGRELLENVAAQPVNLAPGSAWECSNTNYFLPGLLIERISRKTYAELCGKEFFSRSV